jgi:hypothetical protein
MNSASATALPSLGEAATLRSVHDVRQWRERIHQAQRGIG